MEIKNPTKNLLRKCLTLFMAFCMIFGSVVMAPIVADATTSEPVALSAEDSSPTDAQLTELGFSFVDWPITVAGGSVCWNGTTISETTTVKVMQYTNGIRYFFVLNTAEINNYVPTAYAIESTASHYNGVTLTSGMQWSSNTQWNSPQSLSDLKIDSEGRIYYTFVPDATVAAAVGYTGGSVDFYITSTGFSTDSSDASNATVITELDEYPYGTEMYSYEVTLNVDTVGTTYQWQMADSKDGTYTNISDATGKTYYIDHDAYTDKWFRCIIDGTKVTKSVELFHSYSTNYSLVGVSGSDDKWYVSNGVMAYTNNTYEKQFDVLGMYQGYWINASYCGSWYIGADKKTEPAENSYYPYSASIDTVKLTFSNTDDRQVHISVKLQSGYRSLAIGTDTAINSIDQCPLNAIKNPDGSLAFVQIVNASSLASITDSDESMTFTPVTPANAWWCGSYYNANNGLAWPEINSDSVEDDDSAMAVSWTNLASGSTVDFIMSLGTVAQTGASSSTTIGGATVTTAVVTNEQELANALADSNITTITLGASFSISGSVQFNGEYDPTVKDNKQLTLDLNGYTLTNDSFYCVFCVEEGCSLTVTDNSADKNGKMIGQQGIINYGGTLTVNAGTIESTLLSAIEQTKAGGITIINSGTIIGATSAILDSGTASGNEINGGTIISNGSTDAALRGYNANGNTNGISSWTIAEGVVFQPVSGTCVATNANGTGTDTSAQVSVSNWSDIQFYESPEGTYTVVAEGYVPGITSQAALEAAIANAADGATIKLEGDIDLTTALNIAAGKNIVLDLNGYTLTGPSSSYWAVNVEETAKLTVTDSSTGGKITGCAYGIQTAGEVAVTGGTVEGTTAGIFGNASTADVIVSGGIVKGTNTTTSYGITTFGTTKVEGGTVSGAIGVYNNGGNLTVSAGTVTGTNYGVQNINNGTVIVSGGTVTGNTGVANSGTLNVQGGTIEGTGSDGITNGYNGNAITTTSGIVNMTGGYVKGADYAICDYASGVTGNTISGGKLEAGTHILTSYESNVGGTWTVAEGGEILVKLTNSQYGPTNIPSYINYVTDEYFPQGQVTVTNNEYLQISPTGDSDSFYTLTGGDAELGIEKNVKVGDKTYATIEEAIADAGTDAIVIELTGDVTMSAGVTIPAGKNITINGNGYTITRGEDCTDTLFAVTGGTFAMENVTVDGGAIWSDDDPATRTNSGVQIVNPAQGVGLLIRVDSGEVSLNNTTLQNNDRVCNDDNIGDDGSAVQVSNGSFTMTDSTIKDCSVSGKDTAGNQPNVDVGDGAAITIWAGTATITGGEIEGNYGARHGGVSRVNGGTLTLDGVNIHDNYTNGTLGNIAITGGTLKVAGDLVVDNNYDVDGDTTTEANIGLYSGYLAEGDTELSEGANIGLSVGYATSGQTVMTGAEEGDEAYFTVDGAILATTYSNGSVVLTDTIKVSTEAELTAAINAGYKNITLTSDINLTAGITIPAGKEVNIYGNGYTLKRDSSYTGTLFTVTDGSLSLENVTVDGGAIWKNADGSAWTDGGNAATRVNEGVVSTGQLIEIYGSGSVTLGDKATLQNNHRTNSNAQGADRGSAVVVYGTGSFYMDEDATIKDCTVNDATDPDNLVGDGAAIAVHQSNGTEVVISGTITGNYSPRMGGAIRVFQNATAAITIKDATITNNYTNDNMLGAVCLGSNTNVSVSGTVVIDGNYTASGSAANVGANGGTLTEGEDGLADGSKISLLVTTDSNNFSKNSVVLNAAEAEDADYFVTDGDVMGIAYENETLVVASIIDSLSRLEYAIANAADGEVIKLDGNISGCITIPKGKNIVLDLNGYTIDGGWTATVTNYGTLTVRDTSDAGTGTITGRYGIANHSALTVESGTLIGTGNDGIFNATTATNLTVTGGTIKGNNLAICDYAQGGSFSLENCTLECTRTSTGGGGVGYVLGSYGSNIGGEWEIGDGVILKNNCNASQLINTNTETGVAGAGQVTISNWDEIKDSMVAINGQIVVGAKAIVEIDGEQIAYTSMDEAIAAATGADSAKITLLADYDKAITIPEGANVTIDLNGHDIVTSGTTIINNGTLTIVNSSDEPATVQGGDYCVNNSGELNINGDSVSDITIYATGQNNTITNNEGGTLHIDGATIKSNGWYAVLDLSGTTDNTITNAHLECGSDGVEGAFALGGYNGKGGEWTISEGVTMKNGDTTKPADQLINTDIVVAGGDTPVTIVNGDEIALADSDGDGTYTVVTAVAKVTFADGTTKNYATLDEAIAACPENEAATVEILTNTTIDATITIPANKDITITGDATVLGNVADAPMFKVEDGASLTVQGDVTLNAQNKGGIIETDGDVTITGNASLKNGKATNGGAISVANGGSVTVEENATFTGNYASGNGGAIYVAEGGSATVTGGTMTNNQANCGDGIYLDNATLELDGTSATAGITDTIGMGGEAPLIEVTSATIDHKVYVEFSDPEKQMASSTAFIKGTNETDPLTPEELKSSFRCANASYTFDGTSSEDGLLIGKSNEEYVVWFDKDGTAHSYSDINKALEDMLVAQNNGTLADDATLYFVQYQNDANPELNRTEIELTEAIVIPDGLTVNFDSAVKHTEEDGVTFAYEKGTTGGVSPTVVTRADNYLGELIRVEADNNEDGTLASLTITNLTLDGGAVWGENGEIEITDDGNGTAGSVTSNNTGISASAPVIVNGGNLTLGDGATIQNNDNYYGQAGTGFGSQYYGGGIRNEGEGELTMESGSTITGCYAREGGAILNINKPGTDGYVENGNPTVTINGGTIEGNASQMKGAAIQTIYSGATDDTTGGATTIINGGTITDNFSLNDLGTLAVEEGGSLTVNGGTISAGSATILGDTDETQNENAIYVYNKYGDDDYVGATNKPFIEGESAAEIVISGDPTITGDIFLDNPCEVYDSETVYAPVIDASGYTGTSDLEIKVEDDREFGNAIVIVSDSNADNINITLPDKTDDAEYVQQELVVGEDGTVTYKGYALDITQNAAGEITITGTADTDAEKIIITIGGKEVEIEVKDGVVNATVDLSDVDGNTFDITKIESEDADGNKTTLLDTGAAGSTDTAIKVDVVKVDAAEGEISAPAGTTYVNKDGQTVTLESGSIPNDIKVDENGNATFTVNGEEITVYIGVREDAPVAPEGEVADFDNDSASVTVNVQAGLEYAIVDENGNIIQGWIKADVDGTITFSGLTADTAYTVIARTPAGTNTLPSEYTEVVEFTTLTENEATDKAAFETAVEALETNPTLENAIAVLDAYNALADDVKALDSVQAAVEEALATAKSELKEAISDAVDKAQENVTDSSISGKLDAVNTYYASEADTITDVATATEQIKLIQAKAEAEIAVVEEYNKLLTENASTITASQATETALASAIETIRAVKDINNVASAKDSAIDTVDTAIDIAVARELLDAYKNDTIIPALRNDFGVISAEQQTAVLDAYTTIADNMAKAIEAAIVGGASAEEALNKALADAKVDLYAAATMAGLRDLAAEIESDEVKAAIETEIAKIADKTTEGDVDTAKAAVTLAIEKQLAKEELAEIATSYPSNAKDTVVSKYEDLINDATSKDAIDLLIAKAEAELYAEVARDTAINNAIASGANTTDNAQVFTDINTAIDTAISNIGNATDDSTLLDTAKQAEKDANAVVDSYNAGKVTDAYAELLNKDVADITSADLEAINKALAIIESFPTDSQDSELISQYRDDLLEKKEAAILDALNDLKETDNTAVNDIVDEYIEQLNNLDNSGDAAEDKIVSEALDEILANAENEVATKKYQQEAIAQVSGTADAADNDAVIQAIADAIADLNAVEFDVTKSEADNKAAIDAVMKVAIASINNARAEQYKTAIDEYLDTDADKDNVKAEADNGKTAITNAVTTANGDDTTPPVLVSVETLQGLVDAAELEMDKERAKNAIEEAAGSAPSEAVQAIVNAYNTAGTGTIDSQTTKEAVELETARAIAKIELEKARERIAAEINAEASDPNKDGKLAELNEIIEAAIAALDSSEATDETKIDQIKTNAISNAENAVAAFDRATFEAQFADILNKDNATIMESDLAVIDAALNTLGTYTASAQSAMEDLRNSLLEKKKLATVDALNTLKAENSGNTAVEAIIDGYIADVEAISTSGDTAADATANDNLDAIIANAPKAVEFELYKQSVVADLNSYREATDEQAVTTAIENAIAEINGIDYDANSDLGALKIAVDTEKAEQIALISTARKDQYKADIDEYLGADSAVSNVNAEATSGKTNIDAATNGNEPVTGSDLQAIVDAAKLEMDKERAKNTISSVAGSNPSEAVQAIVDAYNAADTGTIDSQTAKEAVELETARAIAKIELEEARAALTEEINGNDNGADKQDKLDALNAVIDAAISALDTTASADIAGVVNTAIANAENAIAAEDEETLTANNPIISKPISEITKDDLDAINAALAELETYTATTQDELDGVRNDLLAKKEAAILDALNDLKADDETVAGVSDIVDGYIAELNNIDSTGDTAADKTASDALTEVLADAENEVAMQIAREQAKAEINGYVDNVNDSDDVKQAIANAVTNIDDVLFDADRTEEQNKQAIDDAKNAAIEAINNARAEQYKAVIDEYLGTDSATNVTTEATNGKTAIESALTEANRNNEILDVAELKALVAAAELEMDKERAKNTISSAAVSTPTTNVQTIVDAYNTADTGTIDSQITKEAVELALDKALAQIAIEAIREEITANIDPDYSSEDRLGAETDIDAAIDAEIAKIANATTKSELDQIVEAAREAAEKALEDYDYNKITAIHSEIIGKTEIVTSDLAAIDAALEDIAALKDATKEKAYFEELRNELLEKKKDAIVAGLEAQKDGSDNVDAMVDTYIAKIEAIVTTGDAEADEVASATLDTLLAKANDGIAFEEYKNEKIEEIGNLAQSGDSSYVDAIIRAAQDAIEALTLNDTATLGSQTAEVDTIVSGVSAELALQRFKDDAVAEYKECYEAITGSALADDSAIYSKLNAETTTAGVNETLGEEIKALVQSLENAKDSATTKGYIDTVLDAIDNAIATANGSDADLSSVLNVTVGTTPTDIKTAVEEQRAAEKATAKALIDAAATEIFGANATLSDTAKELITEAKANISSGDYADYAGIVSDLESILTVLKGVEDKKAELIQELEASKRVNDSSKTTSIINNAIKKIEDEAFDPTKSLEEQTNTLKGYADKAKTDSAAQRRAEAEAAAAAQERAEKAAAKKEVLDDVIATFGENYENIPEAVAIINKANVAIDAGSSSQYANIIEEAAQAVDLLDGVEDYKETLTTKVDGIAEANDSTTITGLIAAAKEAIENVAFDDTKSLDEHKATLDAVYNAYEESIYAQRIDDYQAKVDEFISETDADNVKQVADASKDAMDALVKPTEEQLDAILEKAKTDIAVERFKVDIADANSSVNKDFNDITASDISALENVIEVFEKLDDTTKAWLDTTVSAPYASYLDELEDRLARAEFEKAKADAIAKVEAALNENDGDIVQNVNKAEIDKIAGMTYAQQIGADREAYVQSILASLAKAETDGIIATEHAQQQVLVINAATEALNNKIENGNYDDTNKAALDKILADFTDKVNSLAPSTNEDEHNANIELLNTWLEEAKQAMDGVSEIAPTNLWWLIITLSVVLLGEIIAIVIVVLKKRKATNQVKTYSVAPVALLAATIVPNGAVAICIILGVLIVAAAAVLGFMLKKSPKETDEEPKN